MLSEYLLPIIRKRYIDDRSQYQNALYRVNYALKYIGKYVGLITPLTMYVARHSWVSIARSKNIPLSIKLIINSL